MKRKAQIRHKTDQKNAQRKKTSAENRRKARHAAKQTKARARHVVKRAVLESVESTMESSDAS